MSSAKRKKILFALIALILTLAFSAIASYVASKDSADKMVGSNMKFVYLKEANISFEPFNDRQIVWHFIYAVPNTFDEEFSIFTSVFGNIRFTNPTDLDYRLRKFEKLDIHPYSKEAGYEFQPTTK